MVERRRAAQSRRRRSRAHKGFLHLRWASNQQSHLAGGSIDAQVAHMYIAGCERRRLRSSTTACYDEDAGCAPVAGDRVERVAIACPGRSRCEMLVTDITIGPILEAALKSLGQTCSRTLLSRGGDCVEVNMTT